MKSLIAAATTATLLLVTTGCAAGGDADGGIDFWGNPISCRLPAYEEPFPTRGPGAESLTGRPIETPEGWGWMVFYFEVLGIASNGTSMDNRFCIPVDIHIFGTAGEADLAMLNPMGEPVTPDAHASTTPWFGRFAIQYDPTDPRFAGRPPTYEIHLDAAYEPARDIQVTQNPTFGPETRATGIGCRILVNTTWGGGPIETAAMAQDVGIFPRKTTSTCVYRDNKYNYQG